MDMDLKSVLNDKDNTSEKKNKGESQKLRVHKKPVQLRDIENRSTGTTKNESDLVSDEDIQRLLMNEKKNSLKKPWNKLDTGMKLNRIKLFVENQKETNNLSTEEYEKLKNMLIMTCQSGKINKNNDVNYNSETCEIVSIKSLKYDEEKKKYKLIINEVKKTKGQTKSRSNIDRFIKNPH